MSEAVGIPVAIAFIFAPFGALCAGIITYTEYARHPLPRRRVFAEAARSALVAFVVLVVATALFGWSVAQS